MDSGPDAAALQALAELNKQLQVYHLVAFWLEALVYGIYITLFASTLHIMSRKRALDQFASRLFLVGICMMMILITVHCASTVYKMVRAYALFIGTPPNLPVVYTQDYIKWDNFAHPVILALLTWIGDVLVIYRCFLIWRRNHYVIAIPSILLLTSVITTSINLYWFKHPESIWWETMTHFLNVVFPINLVQNIMTTGLIAYKIGAQYRESRDSGLLMPSSLNLLTVVRIIVESALIYTAEMFVLIILYYKAHAGIVVVQYILPPSIGVVFVLIAVRTHGAQEAAARNYPSNGLYASWMSMEGRNDPLRRPHPMPLITTVTEQHHFDPVSSSKLDDSTRRLSDLYGTPQKKCSSETVSPV